jgi:hypothetical protein
VASLDFGDAHLGAAASSSAATAPGAASSSGSSSISSISSSASRTSHGGRGASLASLQEQEEELRLVDVALPRAEARLETLALWVGAAAAFGGGIWHFQGAEKAQEFFAG